jgi:hypothetical protein
LEKKLSLLGNESVVKLIVPSGLSDVSELHQLACEKFSVTPDSTMLQYMDNDFNDYINLTEAGDIANLMTLRLVRCGDKADTSATSGNPGACSGSSNLRTYIWPTNFEIPQFDQEVQLFLQSTESKFSSTGETATEPRDIKGKMLDTIANKLCRTRHTPVVSRSSKFPKVLLIFTHL